MIHFTVSISGPNTHQGSAEIARAILKSTDREVSEIDIVGIAPLLKEHVDTESVSHLRDVGASIDDDTLRGSVEATPETIDAVLSLFSSSLLTARFIDTTGEPIFARDDSDAESCYLTESEYERLLERLDFDRLTQLRPFGESVPDEQFGSIEKTDILFILLGHHLRTSIHLLQRRSKHSSIRPNGRLRRLNCSEWHPSSRKSNPRASIPSSRPVRLSIDLG